jgi:hypothetical protein
MAGGGGNVGRFTRADLAELHKLMEQTKDATDKEALEGEVNSYLSEVTAKYERDTQQIGRYLKELQDALSDDIEIQSLLFGGSIAKHTYVDGLSDVDALVIVGSSQLSGKQPAEVLEDFRHALESKLPKANVTDIQQGRMAVTVKYADGTEIQLLPAVRQGRELRIPGAAGKGWSDVKPKAFAKELTRQNQRLNGSLVPVIKIAKSLISGLPEQKRLSGYHIEALAVEAVKGYSGPVTTKALLQSFFETAATRVKRPIADVTGQSRSVDSYLGKSGSNERRVAADALSSIARKLRNADSVSGWRSIIEE